MYILCTCQDNGAAHGVGPGQLTDNCIFYPDFFSFPRSAWECISGGQTAVPVVRKVWVPTQSVGTRKTLFVMPLLLWLLLHSLGELPR